MGFIAWIVVGAIAGFLANAVMGSREGASWPRPRRSWRNGIRT